jgi:hypothetical protein
MGFAVEVRGLRKRFAGRLFAIYSNGLAKEEIFIKLWDGFVIPIASIVGWVGAFARFCSPGGHSVVKGYVIR